MLRRTLGAAALFFCLLAGALSPEFGFAQQPRVSGQGQTKKKALKKERKHQRFLNHWGDDTFNIEYCIPGRLDDGHKGQTKGVPCGCIGMYRKYWDREDEDCNKSYEYKSPQWMSCHEAIEECSQFMEHGGDSGIWGEDEHLKCQVYCYEKQSCGCCDKFRAFLRMQKWHRLTMGGMVALKGDLHLLSGNRACNERFVFSYDPVRPYDLFYAGVRAWLYEQ